MANTPNYNLPLFETNSIPSWLRDWNTAMTDIDTAIHNVQTQVTAQSASVTNAVNTANAASATATNVSNDLTSLTARVTALEAGGSGGGGGGTSFNPSNYQISINYIPAWIDNGSWTQIAPNTATQTIAGSGASDQPGSMQRVLFSMGGGQGVFGCQEEKVNGRVCYQVGNFNSGTYPLTLYTLSASIRLNFTNLTVTNAWTLTQTWSSATETHHSIAAGFQAYSSGNVEFLIQYMNGLSNMTYILEERPSV